MIDFNRAVIGALRGQGRNFFNEFELEDQRTLRKVIHAQRRLIFTLMRLNHDYELDGWRYVPGVKADED